MPLWRDDWGTTKSELAAAVAPRGSTRFRGVVLPGEALRLAVGPSLLSYRATVEERDGSFRVVELGAADAHRASVLRAPLPPTARGSRLVALSLVPPRIIERGSDAGVALQGTTTVRLLGGSLAGWIGENGVAIDRGSAQGALAFDYAVTPQRTARFRARQPTDDAPPEVAVTPALADLAGGIGGRLALRIGGEQVPVRVAAVVDRIPGTTGTAVLADLGALSTAIDAASPGGADVSELWLEAAPGRQADVAATLSRPPFAALAASLTCGARARSTTGSARARDAPRARGRGARGPRARGGGPRSRDPRRPARRPRRANGSGGPGRDPRPAAPRRRGAGGAGRARRSSGRRPRGVALAFLVTRVVSVTARADVPEPPLATTIDPWTVALAAALFALAAVGLVLLTTRRAFADPRGPGRVGGEA